jgi:hypothetical protein
MKFSHGLSDTRLRRPLGVAATVPLIALLAAGSLVLATGSAHAAPVKVPLGTAEDFVVLAGAGVTNTGPTTLNGDLGTFPTTSISGPGLLTVNGTNHGGDAVTQGAKTDLVTGYNNAAGQGPTTPAGADLGGQTLTSGVYTSATSMQLTGALTLNAQGNPNAVFVFQAGSTLTTASAASVVLTNGAQACNVYWKVGSSATLGTTTAFRGTIIALTSITLTNGATIEGRALARNGAVTMDTNTITRPSCTTPVAVAATATPSAAASDGDSPDGATSGATPAAGSPDGGTPTDTSTEQPSPRDTTPAQVVQTPTGGIDTGDGSMSSTGGGPSGTTGALAVLALGGALALAARAARRPRRSYRAR